MNSGPVIRRRSVFADRLLEFPNLVFSDGAEYQNRGKWDGFFRDHIGSRFDGRIIFEIGCGDASLLTRVAGKFPSTAFIGIDWKCRTLHSAAEQIAGVGLRNLTLLHGRGQELRKMFADGEISEIWIFHPEPCDKPREIRNRLVAEPFLLDVHHVLREAGALVLKTDHARYYRSTLSLLGIADEMAPVQVPTAAGPVIERFSIGARSVDFWNDDPIRSQCSSRCFANEMTGFERRFRKKRLPIYYLELKKR